MPGVLISPPAIIAAVRFFVGFAGTVVTPLSSMPMFSTTFFFPLSFLAAFVVGVTVAIVADLATACLFLFQLAVPGDTTVRRRSTVINRSIRKMTFRIVCIRRRPFRRHPFVRH